MKASMTNNKVRTLALKPPAKGHLIVWDENRDAPRGFGARITAAGTVSFVLNYRNARGESRRFTIGQSPEWDVDNARAEARVLRVQIDKGGGPEQEKKDERKKAKEPEAPEAFAEKTVKELAEAYMSRHVLGGLN
jgi:Arm DNA-binding domain